MSESGVLPSFRSGFVTIYGLPNAGKSTLLNTILGQKITITAPKVQTTRRRIKGIYTDERAQIVFSDTPGWLKPEYLLHHKMMAEIFQTKEDGDISIVLADVREEVARVLQMSEALQPPAPVFLALNKIDITGGIIPEIWRQYMADQRDFAYATALSAYDKGQCAALVAALIDYLPEGAPFYEADMLTDQSERCIVAELIREQIFLLCREEVPYHTTVLVQSFKDKGAVVVILADVVVGRASQKSIMLGRGGAMIKAIGIKARGEIEALLGKKVYLDLCVKTKEKWRTDPRFLKKMGYTE